jgi:DNA-binding YbaB/EbfC family protein
MSDSGFDLGALFEQAQKLQQQMADAQATAAATEVEGTAGGGAVRIVSTAGGEFRSVTIDPSVLEAGDVEMLQDLVLAALRDLTSAAARAQREVAGPLGDLGGLDLGALGGMLGGGGDEGPG